MNENELDALKAWMTTQPLIAWAREKSMKIARNEIPEPSKIRPPESVVQKQHSSQNNEDSFG